MFTTGLVAWQVKPLAAVALVQLTFETPPE
jgi:hypothetical protein